MELIYVRLYLIRQEGNQRRRQVQKRPEHDSQRRLSAQFHPQKNRLQEVNDADRNQSDGCTRPREAEIFR